MSNTVSKNRSNAASALRLPAPADVAAHVELWQSDPEASIRLRDAVVAACARPVVGLDMAAVAGLAVLSVARHYSRHGNEAHAVNAAVMAARVTVATGTAADGESLESLESPAVSIRLEHWTAPADRIGSVDSLRSRMADRMEEVPADVRGVFGQIAAAWLDHNPAACEACQTPGARPSRLTLSSIRGHVRGLAPATSEAKRLRESDGRTVQTVADALRPLVVRAGFPAGEVWPLVFGQAWRAVEHGDDAAPLAGRSEPRRGTGRKGRYVGAYSRPVPVAESVTVTRDGVTVTRPVTDVERDAAVPVVETRMVAGESVPVVVGYWPGESRGYGDGTTAPAPAGDRVKGDPDGMVLAFPARVSPRKRAAGNTGPTVPVTLSR